MGSFARGVGKLVLTVVVGVGAAVLKGTLLVGGGLAFVVVLNGAGIVTGEVDDGAKVDVEACDVVDFSTAVELSFNGWEDNEEGDDGAGVVGSGSDSSMTVTGISIPPSGTSYPP